MPYEPPITDQINRSRGHLPPHATAPGVIH